MRQALEILRRRKWLFIVPFAVVFLVPFLFSLVFMRSYEANSLVWLDSDVSIAAVLDDRTTAQVSERPIQTEADTLQQLLQSRAFVTRVISETPLKSKMDTLRSRAKTIAFVRKNLNTDVVGPNSLRITFYGRNPEEAVVVVGATTEQFMSWVKDAVKEQSAKSTDFFGKQSESYRKELEAARAELQTFREEHPETQQLDIADKVLDAPRITASPAVQSEFQRLKSQTEYAQELYDSSLSDLARTRVVAAALEERYVNGLRTVDKPVQPVSFSKKRLLLFDFLALVAAVVIGVLAVTLAELADRSLHTEQEVAEALDLSVLTAVKEEPRSERPA